MMPQAYCPLCGDAMTDAENVHMVRVEPIGELWASLFFAHKNCLDDAISRARRHWGAGEKERKREAP